MTGPSIRWGLALVATLLAELTLIALSIVCVAVYSYAIHTGETPEFYGAFAMASGPWVSLIAVMLCTTLVLVVISVMGGWLKMAKKSFRGLCGDITSGVSQ